MKPKPKTLAQMRDFLHGAGYRLVKMPYSKRIVGDHQHPRAVLGWRWACTAHGGEFCTGKTAREAYLKFRRYMKALR